MPNEYQRLVPDNDLSGLKPLEVGDRVMWGLSSIREIVAMEHGSISTRRIGRGPATQYLDCPLVRQWLIPVVENEPETVMNGYAALLEKHLDSAMGIEQWWKTYDTWQVNVMYDDAAKKAVLTVDLFTNRFVVIFRGEVVRRFYADGDFESGTDTDDTIRIYAVDNGGNILSAELEEDSTDLDARRFIPLPYALCNAAGEGADTFVQYVIDDRGDSRPCIPAFHGANHQISYTILRAVTWTGYINGDYVHEASPVFVANKMMQHYLTTVTREENCGSN